MARAGLALPILCGCTAVVPTPPPTAKTTTSARQPAGLAAAHGVPGEAMQLAVSFRGIPVGKVAVAVGRPGWVDGKWAMIVTSRGQTDGVIALLGEVTWELTTTLDLTGGLPIRDREVSSVVFRGKTEHEDREHTWDDGRTEHNMHSAVGVVRGWRSRVGDVAEMEVDIVGADLDVTIWDARREYLASARSPAVRYEGVVEDKLGFVAYLSDDADRVPLLLRTATPWGEVAIKLVEYQAPSR